jgi:large subunit ribosomal protein L25
MAEISLVAESGRPSGTRASRRLRAAGKIPAVIYGHGIEPIPVTVDAGELRAALNTEAGARALLQLKVGNDEHLALARQLQRHPVRHTVTHIDFLVVRRDQVVTAEVPVVMIGEALAVYRANGTVDQEITALAIKARPADIPARFEIDITDLEIGDAIRVGDITLPEGVEADVDLDAAVAVAHGQQAATAEDVAAEEAAAEAAAEEAAGAGAGAAEAAAAEAGGGSSAGSDEG